MTGGTVMSEKVVKLTPEEIAARDERDREMLNGLIAKAKAAQVKYAEYTQEQVDKIFAAAALAANNARIPLAQMAVAESGMGVVEDKVIKNHFAAEYIYNTYKNTKNVRTDFIFPFWKFHCIRHRNFKSWHRLSSGTLLSWCLFTDNSF